MPYRIVYQVNVEWVSGARGAIGGAAAPALGMTPAGGAQVKALFNAQGGQNAATFDASTITTLTNAMAADIAAQMNVPATLGQIQGFASGTG